MSIFNVLKQISSGTLHYNLHRAVQKVIKKQFTDDMSFKQEMVPAVAAYLKRDGKGFVCDPFLEKSIISALESYLSLRREGQSHPEDIVLTVQVKAEKERALAAVSVS